MNVADLSWVRKYLDINSVRATKKCGSSRVFMIKTDQKFRE